MQNRYAGQRLITLARARLKYGYTTDHLAYLCRQGYVWAEREGRTWLTCEMAMDDYKAVLKIAGNPVKYSEFDQILNPAPGLTSISGEAALTFIQVPYPKFASVSVERITATIKRRQKDYFSLVRKTIINTWDRFETQVFKLLGSLRNTFRNSKTPGQILSPHSGIIRLSIGEAPAELPVAVLPEYLIFRPWYRHPAGALALGALVLVVMAIGNPNFYEVPIMAANNVLESASNFLSSDIIGVPLGYTINLPVFNSNNHEQSAMETVANQSEIMGATTESITQSSSNQILGEQIIVLQNLAQTVLQNEILPDLHSIMRNEALQFIDGREERMIKAHP